MAGGAITFTLVEIRADGVGGSEGDHHHCNCSNVEAKGALTLGTGTLTVATDGGPVTFTVPSGFSLDGLVDGAMVEAKGTKNADGSVTLVEIRAADGSHCRNGHDGNGDGGSDDNDDVAQQG